MVTPSFRGTLTPCLSPVSLAHQFFVLPSFREAPKSVGSNGETALRLKGVSGDRGDVWTFSSVAESLRNSLGDWRDPITWPENIWNDFGARVDFYIDLGFDANLTDLPVPAFLEATAVADIRTEPPSLVEAYGPPVLAVHDPDEEEGLARTNEAHGWLQRLESHLRRFIDSEMNKAFGADWPRHQLPNNKYDEWKTKKEAADRSGAPSRPLIAYADFTDYALVICKRDNWGQVFSPVFERPESVRESFQRLHPIRLDTMHARPITQDDELLLYVEAKRLMQRIGT